MITSNIKFLGVDSSKVDLTEKKDALNNAITEYYTAEEIVAPKYKVYTALLTQFGENAPTAIVLENTLGNITYSRSASGLYIANLLGAFTLNKTFVIITPTVDDAQNQMVSLTYNMGLDSFEITSTNWSATLNGYTLLDGILFNTPIEIRVYE
jgi:hypothetical protein